MYFHQIAAILSGLLAGVSGMGGEMAECRLTGGLAGTIQIHPMGNGVHFMGTVTKLTAGKHGFHVHQEGALGNQCKDAGGHYNPENMVHGSLNSEKRHVGDLENIVAGTDQSAKVNKHVNNVDLAQFIGRSIVVHAGEDDLGIGGATDSLTTGNAGGRLDCCIITMVDNSSARSKTGELVFGVLFGLLSLFV